MTNPLLRPLSTLCIVVVTMGTLLVGCSTRSDGADTAWKGLIKIGVVLPFSGYDANSGERALWGARMAANEINLDGGIAGWRLELVSLDDANNAEVAAARARELAVDPQVVAVIGHLGLAAATSAAPVYTSANLPCLALGLGSESVPEGGQQYVRGVGPSANAIADLLANWLSALPTPGTVIVADSDPSAESTGSTIHSILLQHDVSAIWQTVSRGDSANSIILFTGGLTELSNNAYAGERARYVALFEGDTPALSSIAKASGQEWFYISREPVSATAFAGFATRFQAAYGMAPSVYSALAYDAIMAIASSFEASVGGGQTPSRISVSRLTDSQTETPNWAGALPRSTETRVPLVLRSAGAAYPGPLVYPQP